MLRAILKCRKHSWFSEVLRDSVIFMLFFARRTKMAACVYSQTFCHFSAARWRTNALLAINFGEFLPAQQQLAHSSVQSSGPARFWRIKVNLAVTLLQLGPTNSRNKVEKLTFLKVQQGLTRIQISNIRLFCIDFFVILMVLQGKVSEGSYKALIFLRLHFLPAT